MTSQPDVRPQTNPMSGLPINRLVERRSDSAWLEKTFEHPSTQVLVLHRGRVLVDGDGERVRLACLPSDRRGKGSYRALLGNLDDTTWFALSLSDAEAERVTSGQRLRFRGLRSIVSSLGRRQASLAAYARALDLWQDNHRFCGRCAAPTRIDQAGFRRICTRSECGREHFPRLDPAIIVIVEQAGRCLLGRQPGWPAGRYSTLAGFVEPGESLEDAVRREVGEESGVQVGDVHYHSSQPWPFPSSLMLGFTAEALTTDIRCEDELEDARWFTPDQLESAVRCGDVLLPFKSSVSFRLIADWMASRHGIEIDHWPNHPP